MSISLVLFWFFIIYILYVYVGYPLLVVVISQLKPAFVDTVTDFPMVTLLIAAFNEEVVIAEKLENSLGLDYPREKLQILVAADGSDDKTVEIIKSFADQGVELSYQPARRGKMAAITNAIQFVRGDLIVFSDANNIYSSNVIRALVAPFSDPNVGAVSGAKSILKDGGVLGEAEGIYWRYESAIKAAESRLSSCVAISGEVWAACREIYTTPPPEIILDDFYMGIQVIRQGYRLVYAPQAKSYERVSATSRDEMERRSRMIAGRLQIMFGYSGVLPKTNFWVMWQVISHKFMRVFLPFAMLGALLTNIWAVLLSNQAAETWSQPVSKMQILLYCQLVFYFLALVGNIINKSKTIIGKMAYIPTFLVNSNIATMIGFIRFITGRQSVIWQRISR
jgi:poly-beta-1,6-N-acetyl-D-glucosamine synthase